ncbi:MAG: FeoB-associated Cys-rich membrane protein [Oscillospiraceae bacterium]|nr:FeoB-associated Cys-rich membrane protein [Oscillospiraceae bacterium]
MLAWLSANLINIALVAVIALIVGLLIRGMIRDKKAGKSACGGNCAGCGACGKCGRIPVNADKKE